MRWTLVVIAELGDGALAGFEDHERRVLPLLDRHGGRLERRLRSADARTEIHVVSFADAAGYETYLADPERSALRPLLDGLAVAQRVVPVHDV